MKTRGKFIVIEGADGCGKTTQLQLLQNSLASEDYHFTQEPTEGPIGALINAGLRKEWEVDNRTLQMLFTADRSSHLAGISPKLEDGIHVVSDRYVLSTIAYGGDSVSEELRAVNFVFPVPDLTILIRISADVAMERISARDDKRSIFEKEDYLRAVIDRYDQLAKEYPNVVVVSGEQEPDEVYAEIINHIQNLIGGDSVGTAR